jgi:HlyD family secretion protein
MRWLGVALVAAAAAGGWFWWGRGSETGPTYRTGRIDRGDVSDLVTATGTLNAVTQVQVGSQVSGRIAKLFVDFNNQVTEGQVLALIDPAPFEAQLAQAQAAVIRAHAATLRTSAAVAVSRANQKIAEADVLVAQANLGKAKVSALNAARTHTRNSELARRTLISRSELDQSQTDQGLGEATVEAARAQLSSSQARAEASKSQVGQALADLESNRGEVAQAEASLQLAKTNLSYARILSPIRGVVISRNVDVGQTVAASFQAPVLFQIADNLERMQIIANVDEADIGRTREGSEVTFTVDAYPQRTFQGKVSQIRLAPIVNQNVVTYNVVVDVENRRLLLKPGMTCNASILVARRAGTLRVPNGALAFTPPDYQSERSSEASIGSGAGRRGQGGEARSREQGGDPTAAEGPRGERRQGRRADGSSGPSRRTSDSDSSDLNSPHPGRVFVLVNGQARAVPVTIGVTDGSFTELVSGELKEGDEVLVGIAREGAAAAPGGSNPASMLRMGGRSPRV